MVARPPLRLVIEPMGLDDVPAIQAIEQASFATRVKSLMTDVPDLPNFSRFHDSLRDNPKAASNEGHMRAAFFMARR